TMIPFKPFKIMFAFSGFFSNSSASIQTKVGLRPISQQACFSASVTERYASAKLNDPLAVYLLIIPIGNESRLLAIRLLSAFQSRKFGFLALIFNFFTISLPKPSDSKW